MKNSKNLVAALCASVACLAACGGADAPTSTPTPSPVPSPPAAPAPPPAAPSPPPAAPTPPGAPAPAPTSIADLPNGHWMELPNTRIRPVMPVPAQPGAPESLIRAWNGGTVDTARSRLLVWGGGHGDYYGNEMYALDLPSLSMRRIVEPSPHTAQSNCTSALPDGTPTSRHTYDGLTYIAHTDKFYSVNGAKTPCGYGDLATFTYDFTNQRWEMPASTTPWNEPYGTMAVYDAQTQLVYVKPSGNAWASYSPQTNRYTLLTNRELYVDYHLSAAIDSKRRKFVMLGDGVQVIDLQTNTMSTMATTNAPAFVTSRQSPGIGYDPVADRIVAWHGGGNVYALNMDTGVWSQVATNTGPSSAAKVQGTFGRWGYVPQYKVFALVNDIDENAWVFRLAR